MNTDHRITRRLKYGMAFSASLLICVAVAVAQNQTTKPAASTTAQTKAQPQANGQNTTPVAGKVTVSGKHHHRGHRLGMTFETQDDQGIVISKVEESGSAHKAGFREKDKIVSADHHPFKRARQLAAYLSSHGGRPIPVVVMRDDKQQMIMYTPPFRSGDSAWLGVLLDENENEKDQKGSRISQIYPDGPAAQAGLQPGDVITRIDDQQIQTATDVISTIAEKEPQAQTQFVVLRNDQEQKVPVTLGAYHQQAVAQYGSPEGDEGQPAYGQHPFDAIPPQAMRLEHDRRAAEQHQRIEEEIRALRDEIRQLRDEVKQLKK